GQFTLPDPVAVAVGPTGVRGDQQPGGLRVVKAAARLPPAADGLHGGHGSVVVDADVDPAGVAGEVVDPVRDRLLHVRAGEIEVVVFHLDRLTLRVPLPPGHWQPAEMFPLLGVDADHWLAIGLMVLYLLVEVAKLGIPIGGLGAFQRLGGGLEGEALAPVRADTGCPWRVSSSAKCRSDLVVHRSGDIGSPRSSGSTSASRAGTRSGSCQAADLRPPPGRRTRPGGTGTWPASSSTTPLRTVVSLTPATCATARTPPCPSSRASTANAKRCWRSFRCGNNASNLVASCSRTSIGMRMRRIPHQPSPNPKTTRNFFPASPLPQPAGQGADPRPSRGQAGLLADLRRHRRGPRRPSSRPGPPTRRRLRRPLPQALPSRGRRPDRHPARADSVPALPTRALPSDPAHQPDRADLRRDPPTHQGDRPAARRALLPEPGLGGACPRH